MNKYSDREMLGWQAVTVQTGSGIETRWKNPWRLPSEAPPDGCRLLLSTPKHPNGDMQLGEHHCAMWRTAEGAPLECEPVLWCLTPQLPA